MENSYYEPYIEQGYYITFDGMIVTWWSDVILEYPVANGFDDNGNLVCYSYD